MVELVAVVNAKFIPRAV